MKPDFDSPGAHRFSLRVYYEDTDAGGVVYYANYLRFAERARTEMLRAAGIAQDELRRQTGLGLVVRSCRAEFLVPARLDDEITVLTRLAGHGGASLELAQEVRRGAETLMRLDSRIACVGPDGRPARLPAALAAVLPHLQSTSNLVGQDAR